MRTKDEANERRQRERLLTAAWKLFRQKGYQDTTMEDILEEADCSKGRFYYYFHAKAELLDSLYEMFDEKYREIYESLPETEDTADRLCHVRTALYSFMEQEVGSELLTSLYIAQLQNRSDYRFLGQERAYYQIMDRVVQEGQARGDLRADIPADEMANELIMMERAQMTDWCLHRGDYSLTDVGAKRFARQICGYRKVNEQH